MTPPSDKPRVSPPARGRPEPIYPREYGWARVSHEAQVIDHLKKLGGVELTPRGKKAGF